MTDPRRKDKQIAEARRVIVAECYKRGMTIRQTCEAVMKQMSLDGPPSTKTIFNDRDFLLKEWKKERIQDVDDMLQLELTRIDDIIIELWEAWKKSKTDYKSKFSKQKGELPAGVSHDRDIDKEERKRIKATYAERGEREEIMFGDPRYLSEIRFQLIERRKLLGLYAPEKKEVTGAGGKDLLPERTQDISMLTAEEKAILLDIARKVDRTK
ncbi:hypothetical protein [Dyadobacter bucti]|uniref:hypothetical protein n=1 Tax=Dyadobacter bucti TaxID=2572203 RepID=UPI0011083D3C|nr:hypothetical protein [Dyadobacter bucti]